MGAAKETLGYPSRTEAVLALRREGRTTRQIADLVGIEMKTVAALECSAASHRSVSSASNVQRMAAVSLGARQRLRPHAARRNLSVDGLILRLIDQIAESNLVDAVLDDGEWLS